MEKYVLRLLKENSRVIIPEFGAFIIRQQNPPEVAFNGLLTFNDGILTEYVSHHAGISFLEASAKVSDYAEKLKADLKLHNRLTFNEIGWVWTDDAGEKQFTPWKESGRIQTEKQTGIKDIESILKEAEITVKSEDKIVPDASDLLSGDQVPFILDDTLKDVDIDATKDILQKKSGEEDVVSGDISAESFALEDSGKSEEKDHGKPEEKHELKQEAPSTEQVIHKDKLSDKKLIVPEETTVSPVSAMGAQSMGRETGKTIPFQPKKSLEQVWQENELKSPDLHKTQKEKKKRSWLIPISIIVAIIILSGAAWLIFPDQVKNILFPDRQAYEETMPVEEVAEESDLITTTDKPDEKISGQEATPDLNEEESTIQPETPVISGDTQAAGKKYYVVAGCFKSRINAEKYVAELRDRGFNSELFGTHDNLYAVSFSSFSSREQAEKEMNRIQESIEPKAWVLLY